MRKTILIALAVHLLVLCFVWIGFPVNRMQSNVNFYYTQLLMPVASSDFSVNTRLPVDIGATENIPMWNKIRTFNKPKK